MTDVFHTDTISNPKGYPDDAQRYDRRLRGPVDERRELAVDPETGLKVYIAAEHARITTSAGLIRDRFTRSIQLGRQYARSSNKADLYEALRLLGTGCHCLEDFSAHSNYTELCLIEMGERDIFPHVGRRTLIQLRGARREVYPCVTGTFGGVDFLHSVMGEFSDKAMQSEIQELEGALQGAQGGNTSALQDLLSKVPEGIFGNKDEAGKADELQQNAQAQQMQNMNISPRDEEAWVQYLQDVQRQIYPILEWHDEVMQSITETIDKIPILPDLIEGIQEQINVFVFSLLAPYVVPIINQVKAELNTGSNEIIQSSEQAQHIVFHDDHSSDPTHSMISKDHFSNVLNEPAGKVASQVLKWAVPQLIAAWDDDRVNVDRTINRIMAGVLHHPAQRDYGQDGASDGRRLMFGVVEKWWNEKDRGEQQELRDKLSRDGVLQGRNHKPGVHDTGHGCGKPLGMTSLTGGGILSAHGGVRNSGQAAQIEGSVSEAVGGGVLGGIVGGIAGAVGGQMLDSFSDQNKTTYKQDSYGDDGSHTQTYTQTGYQSGTYGQAQYSQTQHPSGGRTEDYSRYEQSSQGGLGMHESRTTQPKYGGGYQQTTEIKKTYGGDQYETEVRRDEYTSSGQHHSQTQRYGGRQNHSDDDEQKQKKKKHGKKDDSDDDYSKSKRYGGNDGSDDDHKGKKYGRKGDDSDDEYKDKKYGDDSDDDKKKRRSGYGTSTQYGRQEESRYQSRDDNQASGRQPGYGERQEQPNYGRESTYGGNDSGYSRREESSGYGRPADPYEEPSSGYGRAEQQTAEYGQGSYVRHTGSGHGGDAYGRQQQSYEGRSGGDGEESEEMPGGFGEEQSSGYGGGESGRERRSGYGEGDDEYNSE